MNIDPYDPRGIANLMLDEAERLGTKVTNLALQKLIYFAHGIFLINSKRPLVTGYFEAWQFGPVHPVVYGAFHTFGSEPISVRATARDMLTGSPKPIPEPSDPEVRRLVQQVLGSYGKMSPGRLVDISHAKNSPWEFVVDKARTSIAFGLRIPDNVIVERFRYHKVSVDETPKSGEPSEDSPFT
jgi:uncharacterized phage-associated protein